MAARRCINCDGRLRGKSPTCSYCRRDDEPRELPPGKWVGGLVKTFVPERPRPMTHVPALTLGVICHCGCLLVSTEETCPACLVWAELDANRASWLLHPRYGTETVIYDVAPVAQIGRKAA